MSTVRRRNVSFWPSIVLAGFFAASPGALADGVMGVQGVEGQKVYALGEAPVELLLSKSKYPAEDGHLDAVVWLQLERGEALAGELRVSLHGEDGAALAQDTIRPLPSDRVFFSMPFPEGMAGRRGALRVEWRSDGRALGRAEETFSVLPPAAPPRSGRIPLTVPNSGGAAQRGAPMTVGVPFPRGALHDDANVRLVDEAGEEVPLQTKVTANWSRFGSVQWIQCDFSVDVDGGPRELFLEYGPDLSRGEFQLLTVQEREGLPPLVDTGPLRFGDGIQYDPGDGGGFRTVVLPEGLAGAFVEHEHLGVFRQPADTEWEIEDSGPEKVVLRRRNWYANPETGERFCQFNTRFILHRGSPLVRLYHTWVFTGDAYEDRIRNMGWRLALAEGATPGGFLLEGDGREWHEGDYLLQYNYEHFKVVEDGRLSHHGGRAPGVAGASANGAQVLVGVKDFWQNYPNELEFADGALHVHQWPRHGRPAVHPPRLEDGLRLWFAHEGELLDFAFPEQMTQDPDFYYASPTRNRRAYQIRHGRETVNAQGLAKTEEIWLLFAPEDAPASELVRTLEGQNDATLRTIADPAWIAASGVFHEIHHVDREKYPEEERMFELAALAPMEWVERIRFYGKWIWGNMTWVPDVENRGFGLYRGFRKAHQGWPYSWIPFARSGDPRLMRFADAATRHQTDVVFCHYSDARVPGRLDDGRGRTRGFTIRFRVPWATHTVNPSSRGYIDKADYMLHSYYLTGYERAWDVFQDWAGLTKDEEEGWNNWARVYGDMGKYRAPVVGDQTRGSTTILKAYVETYQATYDPWFLIAAHQIVRVHVESWRDHGWRGHLWQAGPREFLRFTGCEEYAEFYLDYAMHFGDHRQTPGTWYPNPLEGLAYAYHLTGDEYLLRRIQYFLDWGAASFYDGEPDYLKGSLVWRGGGASPLQTGWWVQYYPLAVAAIERAGGRVAPLPSGFTTLPPLDGYEEDPPDAGRVLRYSYRFLMQKQAGEPVPLQMQFARPAMRDIRYRVENAQGETVLEGSERQATLPAEAPAGVYRLTVQGDRPSRWGPFPPGDADTRGLALPLTPHTVPIVMDLGEKRETGPTSFHGTQYWFMVPEGTEAFWLEFLDAWRSPLSKITVWNPDGGVAWQHQSVAADEFHDLRVELRVAPGHAGELWRVAVSGTGYGMRLSPNLPPYLATDPLTWFDPEQ